MGCAAVLSLFLMACNSKQRADEAWVDSVLQAIDSIPDEQLDYAVEEVPLSTAVDGDFNDFIYTFLNNGQFQAERVSWPLHVTDHTGSELRSISSGKELREMFRQAPTDYFVMFLNDVSQLEEDVSSSRDDAFVHLVDLDRSQVSRCSYVRQEGHWMMGDVCELDFDEHPLGSFLSFYRQFASDSIYQIDHVAQPLDIVVPDEDDETGYIEGTIDADQFPLFSPELPAGIMMVVDYGQLASHAHRIVMAKCGMGNGMMDLLTFEHEGGEWKLVKMEE